METYGVRGHVSLWCCDECWRVVRCQDGGFDWATGARQAGGDVSEPLFLQACSYNEAVKSFNEDTFDMGSILICCG